MIHGDKPVKVEIRYQPDRCIHSKSHWAYCVECVQVCPSGAISMTQDSQPPSYDAKRCLHCGTCLASCAFEAFSSPNFSERKLIARVRSVEGLDGQSARRMGEGPNAQIRAREAGRTVSGSPARVSDSPNVRDSADGRIDIRIRCYLPYGELDALQSRTSTYQLGTCLTALTPGVLFELGMLHACVLDASKCPRCPLFAKVGPQMRANTRAACDLLHDWHVCSGIEQPRNRGLVLDTGKSVAPKPGAAESEACGTVAASKGSDSSGISDAHKADIASALPEAGATNPLLAGFGVASTEGMRRTFDAKSAVHALFARRKPKTAPQPSAPQLRTIPQHESSWRGAVRLWWPRNASESSDISARHEALLYAWPSHHVDTSLCVGCGTCQQMCPVGAIRQSYAQGVFSYRFVPGICVDCKLWRRFLSEARHRTRSSAYVSSI